MVMRKLILRTLRRIVWLLLVLLDVSLNRIFNGRVETISSRAGRARNSGRKWGCVLCGWLDYLDPGHCERAIRDPLAGLE